jgi:hypothetical protein
VGINQSPQVGHEPWHTAWTHDHLDNVKQTRRTEAGIVTHKKKGVSIAFLAMKMTVIHHPSNGKYTAIAYAGVGLVITWLAHLPNSTHRQYAQFAQTLLLLPHDIDGMQ